MFCVLLSCLSVCTDFQDISSLSQAFIQEAMGKSSSGVVHSELMKSLMRGSEYVGWLCDGKLSRIEPQGVLATLLRSSFHT